MVEAKKLSEPSSQNQVKDKFQVLIRDQIGLVDQT